MSDAKLPEGCPETMVLTLPPLPRHKNVRRETVELHPVGTRARLRELEGAVRFLLSGPYQEGFESRARWTRFPTGAVENLRTALAGGEWE